MKIIMMGGAVGALAVMMSISASLRIAIIRMRMAIGRRIWRCSEKK